MIRNVIRRRIGGLFVLLAVAAGFLWAEDGIHPKPVPHVALSSSPLPSNIATVSCQMPSGRLMAATVRTVAPQVLTWTSSSDRAGHYSAAILTSRGPRSWAGATGWSTLRRTASMHGPVVGAAPSWRIVFYDPAGWCMTRVQALP